MTRLAIEGKAKRDEANVAIKMYLKVGLARRLILFSISDDDYFISRQLTLPVDSITPGSAILLFKGGFHELAPFMP